MSLITALKELSPLTAFAKAMYGQFTSKAESEKIYRTIVPMIKDKIESGSSLKDPNMEQAVNLLAGLPPFGAKGSNFERRYLVDERTILDLPDDPDKLSIAYWW
ncbi:hypothetical protein [uncultured Photobacterium sp.]|uniref:hypothetical protein n=1 Tax=uncultured Photobacterium sp. TaxID=173973 RepID=UPI002625F004|nr:hypothetical protein [uncultured Photobacterium sp.]